MESEDRKPFFTRRLILWILLIILIIIIIILLLHRCGKGNGGDEDITASVEINPRQLSLAPGDTYTLYANTNTDYLIEWSSNDPMCVTVDGSGEQAIIQAGQSECTAEITARTPDAQDTITVDVIKKLDELEGLQLNKSKYSVRVNKTVIASVTAVPTTAELPTIYYEIEDTSIAVVSDNGVIKGVKVGNTKLTASTASGISVTSTVVVYDKKSPDPEDPKPTIVPVSKIEFDKKNEKEVCVDAIIPIKVIVSPNNATDKTILWELDNPTDKTKMVNANAKIDKNGLLTGIKAGTVKVKATSKDNSKLTLTTTVTVLSKSSSKCKGSGPVTPVTPVTPTTPDGDDDTSMTVTPAMSCSVSYKKGTNGWYTKYNVTWTYTGGSSSDDGYSERKYCIGNNGCTTMPGSRYYYAAKESTAETKFYYSYRDKDGTTKKADCSPSPLTKLDSTAPTCKITVDESIKDKVGIKVTAEDNLSGIKIIYLNGELIGNYPTAYSQQQKTVAETIDGQKLYSAIVYDDAGNSGTCSAVIKANGTIDSKNYDVSAHFMTYKLTTLNVDDTYCIRGYFKETDGTNRVAKANEVQVSGVIANPSVDANATKNICLSPKGAGKLTVTITGKDGNGKPVTATVDFNVVVKRNETIDVRMVTNPSILPTNKDVTVWAEAAMNPNPSDLKLYVCASVDGDCTPGTQTTVTLTKTGKYTVNYALTSSELTNVTKAYLGRVEVDKDAPTCTANMSPDGESISIFLKDVGSGLATYKIGSNSEHKITSVLNSYTATATKADKGSKVIVTDRAGNIGNCTLSDSNLSTATLDHLNVNPNPLYMFTDSTKSIAVFPYDTDGKLNSSLNGFTAEITSGDCITLNQKGNAANSISLKSNSNTCTGKIVITSTVNTSKKAYVDVIVKKRACSITTDDTYVSVTPSGYSANIKYMRINGTIVQHAGTSTVKFLKSNLGNPSNYEAVIEYYDGSAEICSTTSSSVAGTIALSSVTIESGKTANVSAITTGTFGSTYTWSTLDSKCATYVGTHTGKEVTIKGVDGLTQSCTTDLYVSGTSNGKTVTSNTVTVTVNPTSGGTTPTLEINSNNISIVQGANTTLTAIIDPPKTQVSSYTWTSSVEDCATVSKSNTKTATVTGVNKKGENQCTTIITAIAKDSSGKEIARDTQKITVSKTIEDFDCGSIVGTNLKDGEWTNQSVHLTIECNGKDCKAPTFQQTFTDSPSSSRAVMYIYSKNGTKKECYVSKSKYVRIDKTAPTCQYTTSGKTTWTNQDVTVSVKCTDTGGSGCSSILGTRDHTITTSQKTINWSVKDNAGNTTSCGDYNVYLDKLKPTFTCNITSNNSQYGVGGTCTCTDTGGSGCHAGNPKSFTYRKEDTQLCGKDNAGNQSCVTLDVTTKTNKVCPTGSVEYSTAYCRETTAKNPTNCSAYSGYTYNSTSGKCQTTTTTNNDTTRTGPTPTCDGLSGSCTIKNVTSTGSMLNWTCSCAVTSVSDTRNPACETGYFMIDSKCYKRVNKDSQTIYSGTIVNN